MPIMPNDIDLMDKCFDTCPAVGQQKVNVGVPVTVTPFAHTFAPMIKCCGEPVVTAGDGAGIGSKYGTCKFTISQTLAVVVPVEFGAEAYVGDTFVHCLGACAEDNHHKCNECDKCD